MSYIRWFGEISASEVDLVGGKGANLGEMTSAGLPVPPGFCLTAKCYRDFIEASGLTQTIQEILTEIDMDDPADVRTKTKRIRSFIIQKQVPESIAREAVDAYRQLGQELELEKSVPAPVAVRSSATAEDLPDASFAGQQDTYLNIRGEEELLEQIKRCWASLWTDRAMIYRTRQGFDHDKVYLAVVVQAMIQSDVSGIMFTANPVNGDQDMAVINASWGLGEAIVSGLVSPDTLLVHKSDKNIVERNIAPKDRMIAYADEGGIVEFETPAEQREIPALSDEHTLELVTLGCEIENHYGVPQDIEWAFAQGRCYVLQARPITTLGESPKRVAEETEYHRGIFVDVFPEPLSPVFLSVLQPLVHSMLDFSFRSLGFKVPQEMEAFGAFYNQPYFNRSYIKEALEPLPPSVREPMISQIVDPFGSHEGGSVGGISLPYLRMVARMLNFVVSFPKQLPGLVAGYQAEVAEVSALPIEKLSDRELVRIIKDMVFGSLSRLNNYNFLMISVIKRMYQELGRMMEPYFGEETEELRGKLISGVTGNITMETNIHLWDLAQTVKASSEVCDLLRQYSGEELRAHLQRIPEGRFFLNELDHFLSEFGHREVRFDILYPTWIEDPSPVIGFVRGYLDIGSDHDPHMQQERLVRQRQEVIDVVQAGLTKDFRGRYLVWPVFRWLMEYAELHTRERDTIHFEYTRLFPPFRRMLKELGQRWMDGELIAQPDDVFYLTLDEMEAMADNPRPMHEVAQTRREIFETNKRRPWPDIIRGDEEIYAEGAEPAEYVAGRLGGLSGSPGVVTGLARVIRRPEEFHRLQEGDILVAPSTTPAWTPLFAIAGGVVTEVGGILSHGAIVAREYGIPAVMSVSGATQRVTDGHTVTVDGNKGFVFLEMEKLA